MANEAVCIETPTRFERRTIAAGAVIPFGTIMKLESPNSVVISAANDDPFGGIAWQVSVATDTFTEIVVAMNGKWDVVAAAAVVAGNLVNIGAANQMLVADEAAMVAGSVIGKALEDANANAGAVQVGVVV